MHVGHGFRFNMSVGDASLVNADADALTNGDRLSCLYFLNCTGAAYTYYCLAEHFLRNPNGGSVATIGANESAFPNAASYYMNEFYSLLWDSLAAENIGEAFARSRLPRTSLAILGDNLDTWTHYIYTLLADPEMPMWSGPVSTLALAHPASVNKGTNQITVTATSGGNPADSVVVCLSKADDDYAVGMTDGSGQVTLSFRAESAGTIDVVATGRNYARTEGAITVGGTGAYVAINAMTLDDDNAGGTSGNGDGIIDGGETVDIAFSLRNTGTAAANNVTVTLRSLDPAVTLLDSTAAAGPIAAGGTATATGGVRVTFSATTTDQYAVPFTLVIKENGAETWSDKFKRSVHQPRLELVKLRIDDTVAGNGNGVVEAGEQFDLFYRVKNFGTGAYPGGDLTVLDLDGAFSFLDSTAAVAPIAALAEGENATGLTMTEANVLTGHRLDVSIVDARGRIYQDFVELRPPSAPTALVIDPGLGVDRLKVSWTQSVSTDAARYNVYRALASGGPYTLANEDPVAHGYFVSTGLDPNTVYYFRATTVDTSGNESPVSVTYSGSTNPPQLGGWPIALKVETTSSPAVGDIDGDGDLEIVECADRVYAWHDDGTELVDGDGDAQTWGVLSSRGATFVSSPALARIDLEPGLDILAASRDSMKVYLFNHAGAVLPGWPRPLENTIRAGMVAGDLDADNEFEVIAVDEKGVIYVWRGDGTEFIDGDANPATQGVFYRMTGCTLNYSTPAVADIDADGKEELIVGSQGDRVYVFNENGSISAGWPYVLTSDISGSPAIGDVDNNGDLEIVLNESGGAFRILNHDATQLTYQWFSNNPWNPFFNSSPSIGNVTGDGKLEVFITRANGNVYAMQSNGALLAGWPQQYASSTYTESSPVIADLDGNGVADVLLGSETQYIRAWSISGQTIAGFPLKTEDAMRGVPTAADVDLDGDVDLVAAGWDKSVYVWDFTGPWNAGNAPWPRFHANLHNNGRVGFVVPTPVRGASFVFTALEKGLELVWTVPVEAGVEFGVERAEVGGCVSCGFRVVARGVGASADGTVRVVDRGVEAGERYVYRLVGEGGVVHETAGLYVPVARSGLGQNYPNPFNPVTKIEYWVAEGEKAGVRLDVYDVRGARVRTLVNGAKPAGRHVVEWDGRDDRGTAVGSGVYFYRMATGAFSATRKMLLIK